MIEARPLLPVESVTLTVAVCGPLATVRESHAIEIGPLDVSVVLPPGVPSTLSVNVFDPAAAFSIQIVNHTVPVAVEPSAGCVMNTLMVPGGGGGGGGVPTVTV